MTILYSIVAIIVVWLIWLVINNIDVMKANKWFYNSLLDKGISPEVAKSIMDQENINYQNRVKSGAKGLKLIDHLKEVNEIY